MKYFSLLRLQARSWYRLTLILCALTFAFSDAWGAVNDVHDFTQSVSEVVNEGGTINDINIAAQTYPIKEVRVIGSYNKNGKPGVDVTVSVGGSSWGTQNVTGKANYTKTFTGSSTTAAVTISFVNKNTGSSGNGTFQVTKIQLVEGASSSPSCSNKITVTKVAPENGSFTVHQGTKDGTEVANSGTVDNCGTGTTTLVVVPDADDNYYCSAVTASGSADVDEDEDGNWVITYNQGSTINTTVTATFSAVPSYDVIWTANGAEHAKTSVKKGSKPTFPSTPTSTDYQSKQFVGWATSEWDNPLDDVSAKTIYTYGDEMPAVNGDVEYFAVWAKSTDTYKLMGYSESFSDGNYVFAAYASSKDYAMGNSISSYKIAGTEIDVNSNYEIEEPAAQFVWKVSHIDGTYVSLYNANATTNHYLGLTSSGLTLESSPTTNGQFNPVLSDDGDGLATVAFKSKSQTGQEIEYHSGEFKSYTSQYSYIYIYKEVLEQYITACASCNVNPTLGTPTLTSLANGKITIECPSISAGSACEITDYGFVWKASSDPTIDDNKSQVGTNNQSAAFSKELSISFETGTTYQCN